MTAYAALVLAGCIVAFAWSVWALVAACRDTADYARYERRPR